MHHFLTEETIYSPFKIHCHHLLLIDSQKQSYYFRFPTWSSKQPLLMLVQLVYTLDCNTFKVIYPLHVGITASRPWTCDNQFSHHCRLRSTIIAIKSNDNSVILPWSNILTLLCKMEEWIVYLEGKCSCASKHISECYRSCWARFYDERSLGFGGYTGTE